MNLARLTNGLTVVKQGLDNLDLQIREELTVCGHLRKAASDQRQHTQQLRSQLEEAKELLFQHQDESNDLQALTDCLQQQVRQAAHRKKRLQDSIQKLSEQACNLVEGFEYQSEEFCISLCKSKLLQQEQTIDHQEHNAEHLVRAALEHLQARWQQAGQQQSAVRDLKQSIQANTVKIRDLKYHIAKESTASNELMTELETAHHDGTAAQQLIKLKHELHQREEEHINQQCTLAVQEVELRTADTELQQQRKSMEWKRAELSGLNKTIRALGLPPIWHLQGPASVGSDTLAAIETRAQGSNQTTAARTEAMPAARSQTEPSAIPQLAQVSDTMVAPSRCTVASSAQWPLHAQYLHNSGRHHVQPPHVSGQNPEHLKQQHAGEHLQQLRHQHKDTASCRWALTQQHLGDDPAVVHQQQPQQLKCIQQQHQQQQYYVEEPDDAEPVGTDLTACHHAATTTDKGACNVPANSMGHHAATAPQLAEAITADDKGSKKLPEGCTANDQWMSSASCFATRPHICAQPHAVASRKRSCAQVVVSETLVSHTLQQGGEGAARDVLRKRLLVQEVEQSVPSGSGGTMMPVQRTVLVQETKQQLQQAEPASATLGSFQNASIMSHASEQHRMILQPSAISRRSAALLPPLTASVHKIALQTPATTVASSAMVAHAGGLGCGDGGFLANATGGAWAASQHDSGEHQMSNKTAWKSCVWQEPMLVHDPASNAKMQPHIINRQLGGTGVCSASTQQPAGAAFTDRCMRSGAVAAVGENLGQLTGTARKHTSWQASHSEDASLPHISPQLRLGKPGCVIGELGCPSISNHNSVASIVQPCPEKPINRQPHTEGLMQSKLDNKCPRGTRKKGNKNGKSKKPSERLAIADALAAGQHGSIAADDGFGAGNDW